MSSKLLDMNEDVTYSKALTFANVMEINSIGKCLFTTECKWEVHSIWKYSCVKLQRVDGGA
jgi:hypothetical protein